MQTYAMLTRLEPNDVHSSATVEDLAHRVRPFAVAIGDFARR